MWSIRGKVVIVTGANTGIGFQYNSRTYYTIEAAEDAAVKIRAQAQDCHVECMHLDLANLRSVHVFATQVRSRFTQLHVLINNAGVNSSAGVQGQRTSDGYAPVFGTNHLGPFYLTLLLTPLLLASAPSRVVNVASVMHVFGIADFEAVARCLSGDAPEYSTSKLANVLHGYELQRRYGSQGLTCTVVSPGAVNSDIWRYDLQRGCAGRLLGWVALGLFLSPEQGAATSVHAACSDGVLGSSSSDDDVGLGYMSPYYQRSCCPDYSGLWGIFAGPQDVRSSKTSYDSVLASKLWDLSTHLIEEAGLGLAIDVVDAGEEVPTVESNLSSRTRQLRTHTR